MRSVSTNKKVLISGASFAGLSTAYWMNKAGYDVTITEVAGDLKKGGTPVNIMGNTINVMKRMGLLEQVLANRIVMRSMAFKNAADVTERIEHTEERHKEQGEPEYEIERDVLLNIMYSAVKDDVTFIFSDSITSMHDNGNSIYVTFKNGTDRSFDLVFGCDGIHSVVRRLWFGDEGNFSHFLQAYFSITIVNKLLIEDLTTEMYNEPGKMVMLNAYNNKTDIIFTFFSENEISYDYRDEAQQRDIIFNQFQGSRWRTPELLAEIMDAKIFYFDKLCQVKMPSWTKGRVALVGDAGYCASPAAGRGGSLAIDGAAALADAFLKCNNDFDSAFAEYNNSFRPFIEEVQAGVVNFGLEALLPRTEEAIRRRNAEGWGI